MRGKLLGIGIAAIVITLVTAIAFVSHILIGRFDRIELAQTTERAAQVVRAFEADLDQLAISTRDYAEWDDAQAYVAGQKPDFLEANFSRDSLGGMDVDVVIILAADGAEMYSTVLPESGVELISPAPEELLDAFGSIRLAEPRLRQLPSPRRVLRTTAGLVAFSAVEIRRSNKSEPTGAVMFFARFVRADDIKRVGQVSRLPAQLTLIDGVVPADPGLPASVQAWLKGSEGEHALDALATGSDSVVGYALVSDVADHPVAYFSMEQPRDLGRLGRRTTWEVMGSLAALLVISGTALLAMMLRLRRSWADRAALERRRRRDALQRKRAEQALEENQTRLAHLVEHDPLTDLPNRTYLDTRLPDLLEHIHAQSQSLALLYIDIDRFKSVNDSGGHSLGDAVLKILARRLSIATSGHDIVLRLSADEFVVIAPGITKGCALRSLADRLLKTIREPVALDDLSISLTASMGISLYPDDAPDGDMLLKNANTALHEAKESGRDCYRDFSKEMNAQLSEQLTLERALRHALEDNQIYVEYQPVVDLHTGLLVSFEALARWRSPTLGVVSPGRFIPVAEKCGLVVAMTEGIVRMVLMQLSEWQRSGLLLAPVAVNVAPLQFERTEFPVYVQETALEYGVDPRWINFEVTESAWMQNSNKHIVMIDTLRLEGSRIYIDDFGTGFSNLSYLKTLPVDAVKIDQSFVRGIETDPSDEAIVGGIITMARQLNLATVAEGIETAEQAQRLRTLGCLYGQGYYFSRPMPADKCRALLEQLAEAQQVTETLTMRAFRKVAS